MIGLWRHECQRTFVDKLISYQDKKTFEDILDRVTKEKYHCNSLQISFAGVEIQKAMNCEELLL